MGELNHMACPCASSPPLSLSRQSSVSPKSRKQRALSRGTHTVGQLIQKAVCSFSLGCVRKNAQHPHFDVPKNLQYTSDYESHVFFIKVQMLNGRIMFVGYNWYQTPHSLTMPLLFILLTQKLQVDVMPPKLKHYFLMSWTSLFPNTKEYSLLISFKNGLYGKNASFKDGIPFPNQLARNEWCSHSHMHSDNPSSIIFWITTTLRIVCWLTWGWNRACLFQLRRSWQFFKKRDVLCHIIADEEELFASTKPVFLNQVCIFKYVYPTQSFGR